MKTEAASKIPADLCPAESRRVAAVQATALLDTPQEYAFDRIAQLAAKVLQVPVTLVSLIDRDRQFFKSQCGLDEPLATARETPLSHSFCKHVVETGEPLVVSDARVHPILQHNRAVEEYRVIAYAGMPLLDAKGFHLGSFCAIDHQPRNWTAHELEILRGLAAQVMAEIELRQKLQEARDEAILTRQTEIDRQRMTRFTVHDLRTPLGSLILGIEMLPLMGSLSPAQTECLALCSRSGDMLRSIVDSLLDIDAIKREGGSALTLEMCNPAVLASTALDHVIRLADEKSIRVERHFSDGLLNFRGDEQKLIRVFINLLGNAVKFTPTGGRVQFTVKTEIHPKKQVLFVVRDTGIGIKSSDTPKIFEEGVRLDLGASTGTSTGLGLTFCKHVVEAHGGSITVESTPSQGSTFTINIPVVT